MQQETRDTPARADILRALPKEAVGKRSDWLAWLPRPRRPRPGVSWIGPAIVAASVVFTWPAFSGATGDEGNVAFGLFIGATSIVLMAWSFLLAVRISAMERVFGGLDSMYKAHRWAGSLAVVAMWLHTSVEPEIEGGVLGASESVADRAQSLAGTGQTLLYILVGISLVRWVPYRYWRWTHKLLGVPFAFACLHFYTAEKPYANGSGWGVYFALVMVVGLGAYVLRVVGRDMLAKGTPYRVASAERSGSTTELVLAPVGQRLEHEAGQFAVVKLQMPGLTEPHVFTIASSPSADELRFFIRDLGDWTEKLQTADLLAREVIVEGPYGEFDPSGDGAGRVVWIAGGVGITPFLSAIDQLDPTDTGDRPLLAYCVRSAEDATAIDTLRGAAAEGRIQLELFESSSGRRFTTEGLWDVAGDLAGAHVAVCGPTGLVASASAAATSLGATHVETEGFDIRSGVGPDLSRQIEKLISSS